MTPSRLFALDCDPGIDDAAAILILNWLRGVQEANIVFVSTVGGNLPVAQTTRVAQLLLALTSQQHEVPLFVGYDSPLLPPPSGLHGLDGLGGRFFIHGEVANPDPRSVDEAWATTQDSLVTAILTGPLTNAARWVVEHHDSPLMPERWVVTGGEFRDASESIERAHEFNFAADPESATTFFATAASVDVLPLNVTETVKFTADDLEPIRKHCPWFHEVLVRSLLLSRARLGTDWCNLHDVVTAYAAAFPDDFEFERGRIEIEPDGSAAFVRDPGGPHRIAVGMAIATPQAIVAALTDAVEYASMSRTLPELASTG